MGQKTDIITNIITTTIRHFDFQSQTFLQIVIISLILNLHALYQSLAK